MTPALSSGSQSLSPTAQITRRKQSGSGAADCRAAHSINLEVVGSDHPWSAALVRAALLIVFMVRRHLSTSYVSRRFSDSQRFTTRGRGALDDRHESVLLIPLR